MLGPQQVLFYGLFGAAGARWGIFWCCFEGPFVASLGPLKGEDGQHDDCWNRAEEEEEEGRREGGWRGSGETG